jgi:catechol 2,3-dioxygenase-like lactoylglutathione lyase family enzyme
VTEENAMIQRMDHVGIVVDDLAAATGFFVELGLELLGEEPVEGSCVDRVVGLDGVRARARMAPGPRRRTYQASATSHSPSTTSTPPSPACGPAARDSWARWCGTRTATCSATSADRRGSSSN